MNNDVLITDSSFLNKIIDIYKEKQFAVLGPDIINPKLPEAKSIRELALIINDERAMSVLRSENGTLSSARSRYDSDHPEEWTPVIITADDALKNMTVEQLKKLSRQQIEILTELKNRIEDLLKDREKLVING